MTLQLSRKDWTGGNALGATLAYIMLAFVSLETASLHNSAAAVWTASGFAIAFVAQFGPRAALSVLAGSMVVNGFQFFSEAHQGDILPNLASAAMIASGNMLEALLGGCAMQRILKNEPLKSPRSALLFLGLVAATPAAISAGVGAVTIWTFDTTDALISDIFVTWYFANATGAVIMVPTVLWLLKTNGVRSFTVRPAEYVATLFVLVVLLETLVGAGLVDALTGWPSAYMIWPALILICFRYREPELILALILTMAMAVMGTMRGFAAFPAETQWQSLTYLQVFLAITSGVCFLLKSSLNEAASFRWELQRTARLRLLRVDQLLAERHVIDTLMVHDLHSPLSGVRGALDTALATPPKTPAEIQALERILALAVSTCDEVLERLSTHLSGENWHSPKALTVDDTIERILRLQRLAIEKKNINILKQGLAFGSNEPTNGPSVFLALEVVIENAIAASPVGGRITINAEMDETGLHYQITDEGPGIPKSVADQLFSGPIGTSKTSHGIGLFLAKEALQRDGGHLVILPVPEGTAISLKVSKSVE